MEVGEHQGLWLKRRIEHTGVSNAEFARRAGDSRESLQRLFNQARLRIRPSRMWKILEVLGLASTVNVMEPGDMAEQTSTTPEEASKGKTLAERVFAEIIEREQRSIEYLDSNVEPYSEKPVPEIPTFDLPIAAGHWMELPETMEVKNPVSLRDGRFRVQIRGDSMEKVYPDGSLVEFRCVKFGDRQSKMEIGQDYYVQRAESATFKRLSSSTDDMLTFIALNKKKYPDKIQVLLADVVRLAKAEYVLKKAGK